jgi:molybdopterin synthase sulfur carrier subunit
LSNESPFGGINTEVIVRYYASFKDFTGRKEEKMEVPEGITIMEIRDYIKSRYKKIAQREIVLVALNGSFVSLDTVVHEGDLISIFPPVSGG